MNCWPNLFLAGAALMQGGASKTPAVTYARDLRPILQARCVVCHNAKTVSDASLSGGLALDSYAALRKGVGGKAGHVIFTPGKSAGSELLKRLMATSPTQMMPRGGPPLPPAQIALFKKWIDAGAPAGDLTTETRAHAPSPELRPMPADPGTQEVSVLTLLRPTPDLLPKSAPKDSAFTYALKIGPLPAITSLAFSPDGKQLAVGGYRAVTIWDTTAGRPLTCLIRLAGQVQSLAYRPDGTQLAVAGGAPGASGEVRVFETHTFRPVGPALGGHTDTVLSVAWSRDGSRLATGSQDHTARLWEWPSGRALRVLEGNSEAVIRVCFAPDGKSLYTAGQDHSLRRYDTANGESLRLFSGHDDAVLALAVSPDGRGLVTAGPEPRLRWWNPDSGDTTRYSDGHSDTVNDIVFSRDGKLLASASADHTVRIWDAGSGGQQRALSGSDDWLYAVALSPDGKLTAGAGADGAVRLWETATGRLRLTLLAWPPAGKVATTEWAAITPEGYYASSPAWAAHLHVTLAGDPKPAARLAAFFPTLRQPDKVIAAWQGAALEPAKLPTAPPPPKAPAAARASK
ncbi:MAG TPA: c-type cytochrome domain-containing protein [Chthonomonadaceae bacterium]|nr:c-type cytochrome domain-containing protein [Chthonomonadaceae bacterium]